MTPGVEALSGGPERRRLRIAAASAWRVFVLVAALIASGCRAPSPVTPAADPSGGGTSASEGSGAARRSAPAPAAGGLLPTRVYDCEGGLRLVVALPVDADAVDVALPEGRRRLARVPAASGARYTDGQVVFWSKGAEAMLERDGRTWRCTENRYHSLSSTATKRRV